MTSFHAKKLTLLKRIFYVYPKEFLLWVYFKLLKNHKHTRYLLFENLLIDVAYIIKYIDKERAPIELQDEYTNPVSKNIWWKKDFYVQNDFHWKVIRGFVNKLIDYIKENQPKTIVDIGCANGGRLDILAKHFPDIEFIGLDFDVKEAQRYNEFKNVTYILGYPLDTLKKLNKADMIFSSQSLLHALPKELENYFQVFNSLKTKHLAIFDTNVNGYLQKNDKKLWSKHMGYYTAWCHNYSGYMGKYGYEVVYYDVKLCDFHLSRSDYYMVQIFGKR